MPIFPEIGADCIRLLFGYSDSIFGQSHANCMGWGLIKFLEGKEMKKFFLAFLLLGVPFGSPTAQARIIWKKI